LRNLLHLIGYSFAFNGLKNNTLTNKPDNVLNNGLRKWLENHRDSLLTSEQVEHARTALSTHERNTNRKTAARQHLRDLKCRQAA